MVGGVEFSFDLVTLCFEEKNCGGEVEGWWLVKNFFVFVCFRGHLTLFFCMNHLVGLNWFVCRKSASWTLVPVLVLLLVFVLVLELVHLDFDLGLIL